MYKGVPKWCMFNCQNYDLVYYDVILQRHRRINTPPPKKKKQKKKNIVRYLFALVGVENSIS